MYEELGESVHILISNEACSDIRIQSQAMEYLIYTYFRNTYNLNLIDTEVGALLVESASNKSLSITRYHQKPL